MEFTRRQFWTVKGIMFGAILAVFVIMGLWYGSVAYRQGYARAQADSPAVQFELSGLDYCYGGGVYYQVRSFNPRGMIFKVKKGQ